MLVPDGVFDDKGTFRPLPDPTHDDVRRLLERAARRISRALEREFEESSDELDALASLDAAALVPSQTSMSFAPPPEKHLCAALQGFSLHAATRVRASDRKALYRLCHYGARGAIALSRLRELPDGRFSYEMKRSLPGGRTHLVMTGTELLAKLTPLIRGRPARQGRSASESPG
ncbi:MAG: transposase [Microbacteriaceae bacterium]|nr:transposase [Microbacteriaceae bacterium]